MVVLYKDFAKTAQDILRDDFDFSRKLKIKTKAANGVAFTTEGEMDSNKSIVGKLAGAFSHPQSGIVFKKLQVTTGGKLVTEAEAPNVYTPGLKVTAKTEDSSLAKGASGARNGVFGFEYVQPQYSVQMEADLARKTISKSTTYAMDNVLFGAMGIFNVNRTAYDDHNVAIGYVGPDYAASVQTKKKFNAVSGAFHHHLSPEVVYSAVFDYNMKNGDNKLSVGGRYKADPLTTYAGKVESDGHVSLALVQKIRPFLSLSTSAYIDAKNFDGDAHKFGLGLTLG